MEEEIVLGRKVDDPFANVVPFVKLFAVLLGENSEDEDAEEVSEDLNLEVVDDEALTEAVLKRVVERLLKRK